MRANNKRPRGRQPAKRPANQKYMNFDSNGPDVRVRGNAMQVYEKYVQLAKDVMAEDRFKAENYLQHAEHYHRVYQAALAAEENRREERMVRTERHQRPRHNDDAGLGETPAAADDGGVAGSGEQPSVPGDAMMTAAREAGIREAGAAGDMALQEHPRARRMANRGRDRHPVSRRRGRPPKEEGEESVNAETIPISGTPPDSAEAQVMRKGVDTAPSTENGTGSGEATVTPKMVVAVPNPDAAAEHDDNTGAGSAAG